MKSTELAHANDAILSVPIPKGVYRKIETITTSVGNHVVRVTLSAGGRNDFVTSFVKPPSTEQLRYMSQIAFDMQPEGPDDGQANSPDWVVATGYKIIDMTANPPEAVGDAKAYVLALLADIEAENLPIPDIAVGPQWIGMDWEVGNKELKIICHGNGKLVMARRVRGKSPNSMTLTGKRVEGRKDRLFAVPMDHVRDWVAWAFESTEYQYGWPIQEIDRLCIVGPK